MAMSKTMEKYFDDLHAAEFGYKCDEEQPLYPEHLPIYASSTPG